MNNLPQEDQTLDPRVSPPFVSRADADLETYGFDERVVVRVWLPSDRTATGTLRVETQGGHVLLGPFDALGSADQDTATRNNNKDRDPSIPFGHTPLGTYHGSVASSFTKNSNGQLYSEVKTSSGLFSYGREGLVHLSPQGGPALTAKENGRTGLLIHAGDLRNGALRPTAGCLRLSPSNMLSLSTLLFSLQSDFGVVLRGPPVEVRIEAASPIADTDPALVDPPPRIMDDRSSELIPLEFTRSIDLRLWDDFWSSDRFQSILDYEATFGRGDGDRDYRDEDMDFRDPGYDLDERGYDDWGDYDDRGGYDDRGYDHYDGRDDWGHDGYDDYDDGGYNDHDDWGHDGWDDGYDDDGGWDAGNGVIIRGPT